MASVRAGADGILAQAYTCTHASVRRDPGRFAVPVLASLAVKLWLATRQMRHVAQHREQVPAAFAATVTADAPARRRLHPRQGALGLLTMAFGTATLLGWTLLGGLDLLNDCCATRCSRAWGDMAYQLALLTAFTLIGGCSNCPSSWYSTFRIEQRFGFNRMTPRCSGRPAQGRWWAR
jgi:STE24 endopeptidase